MAVFSSGGTSYPDFYISLLFLSVTLVFAPLNLLVFLHNSRKPSSVARTLYLALSAVDLAACLVIPICWSKEALQDPDPGCGDWEEKLELELCENDYYVYSRNATTAQCVQSIVVQVLSELPTYFTGFLALTRFYQIRFPLRHLSKRVVNGTLTVCVGYFLAATLTVSFRPDAQPHWDIATISAIDLTIELFGYKLNSIAYVFTTQILTLIVQLSAVVASILTILDLLKNYRRPITEQARLRSVRGSIRILVTNLGSTVFAVMIVYSALSIDGIQDIPDMDIELRKKLTLRFFWMSIVLPLVLSAANPVIYILFTPKTHGILGLVRGVIPVLP